MGRITVNGTQAGFSSKKNGVPFTMGCKSQPCERQVRGGTHAESKKLDNIKAQITKHYQYICDHDSFVTAKKVYNRYAGFSEECHTLMVLFREQIESYKEKIGKGKAESTYRGLVADYKKSFCFS